ncbi:MAG: glycine oxidase ThiO [Planctomycetia bacterium]|nr:glycine oxidase ThiO [Planctomycetia bacterium]
MDDCLIIGGGVVGLSLAYELAAQGLNVHLLERGETGQEASWAGAGILPAARRSPGGTAAEQLAALSRRLHPEWSERLLDETGIDTGFTISGEIHLARTPEAAEQLARDVQSWSEADLAVEPLPLDELRSIEPALADGAGSPPLSAWRLPETAQVRNPRHLKALTHAVRQRGVRITSGAEVQSFAKRNGEVTGVVSTAGEFQAQRIVLSAGAWSAALLEQLGCPAKLKPIRGQIALLRLPEPVLRSIVHVGPHYLVPRGDGRVLVGSTLEDVGFDKQTTEEAIDELLAFACQLVPALGGAEVERTWAGLRPGNLRAEPLIGPVPGLENVLVATGHFRWGLYLSTGTAVLLRQLICGEPSAVPLDDFRPGSERG